MGSAYYEANKERIKAQARAWAAGNPEKAKESYEKWAAANPDKVKASNKASRKKLYDILASTEDGREKIRSRARAYKAANRAKVREQGKLQSRRDRARNKEKIAAQRKSPARLANSVANMHKRRTRETGAGGSYTNQEWISLKIQFGCVCLCCGRPESERKLTADHVVPVARDGSSNIDNIQPLCKPCNSSKNARHIDYRPLYLNSTNSAPVVDGRATEELPAIQPASNLLKLHKTVDSKQVRKSICGDYSLYSPQSGSQVVA